MAQVTSKGKPLNLAGSEVRAGDRAPDFALRRGFAPDSAYTLATDAGKVRLINTVLSLDTGICDRQTREFNQRATALSDQVVAVTVSADLPPAQARWCGAAGVDRVIVASDYYDHSFGRAYGIQVEELGVLARAIFVVDGAGRVIYREVVSDLAADPDYDQAIAAAQAALR
jgi:thiol peroxidase